ncbi:MAG: glycosyltransferase [Proteobacteria bacterium]|nr:glycosyltransferase [Pseudomonadota bacterium]
MRKISILYFIPELGTGGTERLVFDLCRLLDRAAFTPSVCTFTGGNYVERLREAGVDVCLLTDENTYSKSKSVLQKVRQFRARVSLFDEIIKKNCIDIINSHHFGPLLHMAYGRERNRRVWMHTEHIRPDIENAGSRYLPLTRWAYRLPDLVSGVSQEVINYYTETIGVTSERTRLVLNGVNVKAFAKQGNPVAKRHELGLSSEDFVIGIMANLRPQKNQKNAIIAFSLICENYPRLKLVLAGDGNCRPELERLVRENRLENKVHFLGYRSDAEELMEIFDVYCLPSFYEGMPLSIMEAWSAGKPVVATDVLGTRELVKDGMNGVLVPTNDPVALGKGLKRVIDDNYFRSLISANGEAFAHAECSIDRMVEKYEMLYRAAVIYRQSASKHQ